MSRRILKGVVVNDVSDKTVSVRVDRRVEDSRLKKPVTRSKKYLAHDSSNSYKSGDVVIIEESRPYSKRKSWVVMSLFSV